MIVEANTRGNVRTGRSSEPNGVDLHEGIDNRPGNRCKI